MPCHSILGELGSFCPALLVKCFLDYRNFSVEQCRAAAGMNNSRGNQLWQKLLTFNQIISFPFQIQAIADPIHLEDEFS